MNPLLRHLPIATLLSVFTFSAHAATLDFEGISHGSDGYYWNMPAYAGYQWSNFGLMDQSVYTKAYGDDYSGFVRGATSGVNQIFNLSGNDAAITRSGGGLFDFNSANMISAWLSDHAVKVTGWLNGIAAYEKVVTLQKTSTQSLSFDFIGIDKLTFSSVKEGRPSYEPTQFILDDMALTVAAVPEPSTYAMLIAGLGVIGLVSRRCKRD